MATPHAVLPHALEQLKPARPSVTGHVGRCRSGLLLGVTAALTLTVLPGTAAADPVAATDAAQAAQLVADAEHELEVVTEQLNEAKVQLERQHAAVAGAEQAAADAQAQLDSLDGQVRQLARSAYTTEGFNRLDVLLTTGSVEELLHQLGTLDAIAGHTNEQLLEIGEADQAAEHARVTADEAEAEAARAVDEIAARQDELEGRIADYQEQYDALSVPQQAVVARAHGGEPVAAVPRGVVAPSGSAQVAVDTALAQVGDAYVWGAGGPDAFDCSGLVQYAYSAAGVSLPHSSRSQSTMGTPVPVGDLQPGDLLFYYSPTSHVGMYIGNGQMVHASTSSKPVMVAAYDSMSGFTHARRITG